MDEVELLRQSILGCTRCSLREEATNPVPFGGPMPSEGIVVIAEAPGKDEDLKGEPLCGKAGQLLQEEIRMVGLDWSTITRFNTAACFPAHTKTPQKEHIDACESNKLALLDLADPTFVLLLGRVAVSGFRSDLTISQARGRPFRLEEDGPVFFSTYHPSAALRKFDYLKQMRDDLERFKALADGVLWTDLIGERCVICAQEVQILDCTGIPWCGVHFADDGFPAWGALALDEGLELLTELFPGITQEVSQ